MMTDAREGGRDERVREIAERVAKAMGYNMAGSPSHTRLNHRLATCPHVICVYHATRDVLVEKDIPWLLEQIEGLRKNLAVAEQIGDTFWAALKPLNLPAINVANPGQHVTDLIADRDHWHTRCREVEAALRERKA